MKIDCISDLHGYRPKLPGGDMLIVAGDLTARDNLDEYLSFRTWLGCEFRYKYVVLIAGNHDGFLVGKEDWFEALKFDGVHYLCDSGCEIEGLKIWGSPYTPMFCNWHFMADRGRAIRKHWDLIPDDTDILVTHGPPVNILDRNVDGEWCGCSDLREAVDRVEPKLHVFGHIHESYGQMSQDGTQYVNASFCDEYYRPVNKPIRVEL